MYEPRELKQAKRDLLQYIDAYAWKAARGELDDSAQAEEYASGIRTTASRYRALGGDIEELLRERRSSTKYKFDAVQGEYCTRTGKLLYADTGRQAEQVMAAIVSIAGTN